MENPKENKQKGLNNVINLKKSIKNQGSENVDNRFSDVIQGKFQGFSHYTPTYQPIQKKENNTGLPDNLKSGIENLSGYSMDDVTVHYNSNNPAQLQAHAYAQGSNIYLSPGQEKHLPHEAWHVVQQKQGRVKPTLQMKGKVDINDDAGLEKEADLMGSMALQMNTASENKHTGIEHSHVEYININGIVQGVFDWEKNNLKQLYDQLRARKDLPKDVTIRLNKALDVLNAQDNLKYSSSLKSLMGKCLSNYTGQKSEIDLIQQNLSELEGAAYFSEQNPDLTMIGLGFSDGHDQDLGEKLEADNYYIKNNTTHVVEVKDTINALVDKLKKGRQIDRQVQWAAKSQEDHVKRVVQYYIRSDDHFDRLLDPVPMKQLKRLHDIMKLTGCLGEINEGRFIIIDNYDLHWPILNIYYEGAMAYINKAIAYMKNKEYKIPPMIRQLIADHFSTMDKIILDWKFYDSFDEKVFSQWLISKGLNT